MCAAGRRDEADSWLVLERLRWAGSPDSCPRCGTAGRCYPLRPRAGARVTRTGATTPRRVWKCGACRGQFSVLTATILHGTRVPLGTWLAALTDLADTAHGAELGVASTASQLVDRYGVTAETARHMTERLRAVAAVEPVRGIPAGRPEALIRAVLHIPPDDAARIREATPSRRRPRRQIGPSANYGDADDRHDG